MWQWSDLRNASWAQGEYSVDGERKKKENTIIMRRAVKSWIFCTWLCTLYQGQSHILHIDTWPCFSLKLDTLFPRCSVLSYHLAFLSWLLWINARLHATVEMSSWYYLNYPRFSTSVGAHCASNTESYGHILRAIESPLSIIQHHQK